MRAARRITVGPEHYSKAVEEQHMNPILAAAQVRFPDMVVDRKEPYMRDAAGSWIVAKTSQNRFVTMFRKYGFTKSPTGVALLLPAVGAKS